MEEFGRIICLNLSCSIVIVKEGNLLLLIDAKISPNVGLEPTTLRLRVSCSTD